MCPAKSEFHGSARSPAPPPRYVLQSPQHPPSARLIPPPLPPTSPSATDIGSTPLRPCATGSLLHCTVCHPAHSHNSRSFVEFVVLDVAPEAACNGKVHAQPPARPSCVLVHRLEPNFLIFLKPILSVKNINAPVHFLNIYAAINFLVGTN